MYITVSIVLAGLHGSIGLGCIMLDCALMHQVGHYYILVACIANCGTVFHWHGVINSLFYFFPQWKKVRFLTVMLGCIGHVCVVNVAMGSVALSLTLLPWVGWALLMVCFCCIWCHGPGGHCIGLDHLFNNSQSQVCSFVIMLGWVGHHWLWLFFVSVELGWAVLLWLLHFCRVMVGHGDVP